MDSLTLFDNFETITNAPNGISRLREFIFDQAVRGKLTQAVQGAEDLSSAYKVSHQSIDIPGHWGVLTFENNFDLRGGGQPPKSTFIDSPKSGYVRLYQIRDYGPNPIPVYVPEKLAPRTTSKGDILIARYGASGKVFWAEEGAYNVALAKLVFPKNLYLEKFAYLMFSCGEFQQAVRHTTRVAVDGFNKNDLRNVCFPLPPLEEQQEIISKVDELMSLCDELEVAQVRRNEICVAARKSAIDSISTAATQDELEVAWNRIRNNWTTIVDTPESVASLRSLILDLAVRGSLSPPSVNENVSPLNLNLKSMKLEEDKLWSLPTALPNPATGWTRLPLACLGKWGSGGTPTASRKEYYQNGTIPWAVIGDLNNSVMTSTESSITKEAFERSSTKMVPVGAVLVAMYGASIGKSAIAGIECCTNQAIAHCVVNEEIITPEYMFLVIRSLKNHLIEMGKGAAQPNISQSVLKHLVLDIPSLRMQKKVIERTDELLGLCEELAQSLSERNQIANRLTSAVTGSAE